jgi:hypothetical protein
MPRVMFAAIRRGRDAGRDLFHVHPAACIEAKHFLGELLADCAHRAHVHLPVGRKPSTAFCPQSPQLLSSIWNAHNHANMGELIVRSHDFMSCRSLTLGAQLASCIASYRGLFLRQLLCSPLFKLVPVSSILKRQSCNSCSRDTL